MNLNFEISKVRVNLTIKIGNFTITDRLPKGFVFDSVKKVVDEWELNRTKNMSKEEKEKLENKKKNKKSDKRYFSAKIIEEKLGGFKKLFGKEQTV